ncbi:hypothetical protein RHEC894_PA00167 (plasmid) [Rhizobium sp. CIAT894]|nr:hypothetical protein RHEC894_PA00167 [Rhizobium sp. CIAT894]
MRFPCPSPGAAGYHILEVAGSGRIGRSTSLRPPAAIVWLRRQLPGGAASMMPKSVSGFLMTSCSNSLI